MLNITPTQLRKAADIQERIQSLQEELGQLLGGPVESGPSEAPKKRKMSAAGRRAIAAAAKARWAAYRGTAPSAGPVPKKKRKLSAQGLANIRAGVAKRMAAQRKSAQKPKRKMTPAWRAALARAWEARRAKAKAATKNNP